ncbi:MAG: hypothetical protein HYT97_09520 [Elusimicrobia bacterium]|nr:hypothetical protein [Elusimicrobiota bacterium]
MNNLGEEFQRNLIQVAYSEDSKLYPRKHPPRSKCFKIFQIFFNLLGALLGYFFVRFPSAKCANRSTIFISRYSSKDKKLILGAENQKNFNNALRLIQSYEKEVGKKCSLLILTSHPETIGQQFYLLGQLIAYAVKSSEFLCPDKKFKLVQAIDSFALDSLHPFIGAAYAGLISSGHCAVDRKPYEKFFLQKFLFKRFHYTQAIFHILKILKNKEPLCLALAGGVAHNSRVFYTIREFAHQAYFHSFPKRLSKQTIAQSINSILTKEGSLACSKGMVGEQEMNELIFFLQTVGIPAGIQFKMIEDFKKELQLKNPWRLRFFRILLSRISSGKIPLIILPIAHSSKGEICLNQPFLIISYNHEGKKVKIQTGEGKILEEDYSIFFKTFVENELNRA